jgi:hypothetical protein
LLLLAGVAVLTSFLKRSAEAIEPDFPQLPVLAEPRLKLTERFGPKRIEAALPIRPHGDEPGLVQDPQMAGHAGLMAPLRSAPSPAMREMLYYQTVIRWKGR